MIVVQTQRMKPLDDGVWKEFGGSRFLICHTSNLKFQRTLAKLQAPFRKDIEKGRMDPEESKKIVCQSLAEAILLDWDQVIDSEKQPVQYNSKVGKTALMNDESLREFIQEVSTDLANYKDEELVEKGND